MLDEIVPVIENRPLTGGHFLLSLDAPRQAPDVRPGQFAMVRILGRSDVLLRRPMSIFDIKTPGGGQSGSSKKPAAPRILQLLYKIVGRGTRLMAELKPGDKVGLLAPLGHGFFEEEYLPRAHASDEILQVAGGIGIAALMLPAKQLLTSRRGATRFPSRPLDSTAIRKGLRLKMGWISPFGAPST